MRTFVAALGLALTLTSCSGPDPTVPAPGESPDFNRGTVLIDTGGSSVLMYAFVAESAEQPPYAVLGRPSLEEDKGVVFLYFEVATGEFEIRGSHVPLSVAFFDTEGEILDMADMEPCAVEEGECPGHDPGDPYVGALAVSEGAFARLGVTEGDVIEIVPGSE